MRLEGKNGLVTAAGSGMGRAGAIRFAKEGASVGVVDIDEDSVNAVVSEIEAKGGKAVGIVADLTKDDDSRRIVRETANALGGLDFMWDHVGHPGPASIEGIEMKDFDTTVDLNMRDPFSRSRIHPRPEMFIHASVFHDPRGFSGVLVVNSSCSHGCN